MLKLIYFLSFLLCTYSLPIKPKICKLDTTKEVFKPRSYSKTRNTYESLMIDQDNL